MIAYIIVSFRRGPFEGKEGNWVQLSSHSWIRGIYLDGEELLWSGCFKMGVMANAALNWWNALSASIFHARDLTPLFSKTVRGLAIKFVNPRKCCSPMTVRGCNHSFTRFHFRLIHIHSFLTYDIPQKFYSLHMKLAIFCSNATGTKGNGYRYLTVIWFNPR